MGKHKFTDAETYALWTHYKAWCFWCGEPLRLKETTIDHFIPEHLENKPVDLDQVRTEYGLSSDFVINDYCNWLPCHDRCNRSKGAKLPLPIFQAAATLQKLASQAERIRAIERRTKNTKKEKLLGLIMVGRETNTVTEDDVLAVFTNREIQEDEDVQILRKEIHLDVDQHFIDFLNRKPDPSSLAFWKDQIIERQQLSSDDDALINTSTAFFLSTELFEIGYLVYRMYKAAYGDAVGKSTFNGAHQLAVPIIRLTEFLPAVQKIGQGVVVGKGDWKTQLASNKYQFEEEFAEEFVSRSRFTFAHPTSMSLVDALNTNAGSPLSEARRNQLVSDLSIGVKTRAQALLAVAEDQNLVSAEFNRAFVLMQYFGYLRRDPNDTPDGDFTGYEFWLRKLDQLSGNYVGVEMVKAFITSDEYRKRFDAS